MSKHEPLIQKTKELRDVSFVLRNLFGTGSMVASEIMQHAGHLLPKYRKVFENAAKDINLRGIPFSEAVEPLFDSATLAVIRAGEESGSLSVVFDQIWQAAKIQTQINKTLSKLKTPVVIGFLGLIVTFVFLTFLIPFIYEGMAQGAPPGFEPIWIVKLSIALNSFIMGNYEIVSVVSVLLFALLAYMCTQQSFITGISNLVIKAILKFEFLGVSYSNLKFGILTQYIQIVSNAGLDAERRIDLVMDSLPEPLRPALLAFKKDMIAKGIPFAASADGKPESDPRHSPVLWPRYVRLAFAQANEGDWVEPMREFGHVMLEDGQEAIEARIAILQNITLAAVGLLITIPMSSIYMTMGQLMQMRMQGL